MPSHCRALSLCEGRGDRVKRGRDGTRRAKPLGRGTRPAESPCVMGNGAAGKMKDPALKRPKLAVNDYWVTAGNLPGDLGASGSPWV